MALSMPCYATRMAALLYTKWANLGTKDPGQMLRVAPSPLSGAVALPAHPLTSARSVLTTAQFDALDESGDLC